MQIDQKVLEAIDLGGLSLFSDKSQDTTHHTRSPPFWSDIDDSHGPTDANCIWKMLRRSPTRGQCTSSLIVWKFSESASSLRIQSQAYAFRPQIGFKSIDGKPKLGKLMHPLRLRWGLVVNETGISGMYIYCWFIVVCSEPNLLSLMILKHGKITKRSPQIFRIYLNFTPTPPF